MIKKVRSTTLTRFRRHVMLRSWKKGNSGTSETSALAGRDHVTLISLVALATLKHNFRRQYDKKGAKHNLNPLQTTCYAEVLEKGKQRYERDFSFSWSRPCNADFPCSVGNLKA